MRLMCVDRVFVVFGVFGLDVSYICGQMHKDIQPEKYEATTRTETHKFVSGKF